MIEYGSVRQERPWTDSVSVEASFASKMQRPEAGVEKRAQHEERMKPDVLNNERHDRFFLITHPRTASNLLVRMLALEDQPNIITGVQGGYFFLQPTLFKIRLHLRDKPLEQWTQNERDQMMQAYQDSFDNLQEHAQKAKEEGKILFVKEHAIFMAEPTAQERFMSGSNSVNETPWTGKVLGADASEATRERSSLNDTFVPDAFLKTWLPTFLIRHPALVFPSYYRAVRDIHSFEPAPGWEADCDLSMTMKWTRTLYDFYSQHLGRPESEAEIMSESADDEVVWPLILDADDVMTKPEVVLRFCQIVGLDQTKLRLSWPPASETFVNLRSDIEKRMLGTIMQSSGVVQGMTSANLDIGVEAVKWREEFGERGGETIERAVRDAMPGYEYMKARKLNVKTRDESS